MRVPFVTCDVFTRTPFAGNPLLVVPDARGLAPSQMQAIAREINYSESTFVLPPENPVHGYRQRTFVPLAEIPFAGHPTIGTAFVLASLGKVPSPGPGERTSVTVEVGFGPLRLELSREDDGGLKIEMEQGLAVWDEPLEDPATRQRIAAAIDVPEESFHTRLRPRVVSTGNRVLIVPLRSVASLSAASALPRALEALEREHGVIVVYPFAFGDGGRVRARGFASGAGVPEDPATGSAAGPLGIYLGLESALPGGSRRFLVDQGIEMGRPSEIEVAVDFDGLRPTAVKVAGSAVRMMEGTIEV